MLFIFIIILSILFNYFFLINNEIFILAIFLMTFFLIIYVFMSFSIKNYFFYSISNILHLLKYSNVINIYLDKVLYYNIMIQNIFYRNLLKNKSKLICMLNFLNKKLNKFLFFNVLNFFLNFKKNFFKILRNKNLIIINNKIRKCEIIL